MSNQRSFYQQLIAEVTGETAPETLREIEEILRHDVFHSTLDWQTRAQLRRGIRKAHRLFLNAA